MAFGSLEAGGALSGAASGAAAGATLGPWGALAGGVLGGAAGLFGASSSKKAQQQAAAAAAAAAAAKRAELQKGLDVQQQAGQTTQGYLSPFIQQGQDASGMLSGYLGTQGADVQRGLFDSFQNDPGAEAAKRSGINAIQSSAAAGGLLRSGGAMKDLYAFGDQFQQQQFQDRMTRLYQMSGLGGQLAGTGAQVNQANANAQGALYDKMGDASAFGILGPASLNMQSAAQGQSALTAGLGLAPGLMGNLKTPINNVTGYLSNVAQGAPGNYGSSWNAWTKAA